MLDGLALIRNALHIAKKARQEEQAKKDANDRDISEYFTKGTTKTHPKTKVCQRHSTDPLPSLKTFPLIAFAGGENQSR